MRAVRPSVRQGGGGGLVSFFGGVRGIVTSSIRMSCIPLVQGEAGGVGIFFFLPWFPFPFVP